MKDGSQARFPGKRLEREKRATERRKKREGTKDTTDDDTTQARHALFEYVGDLGLTPEDVAWLMRQGYLGGRDVRVRWNESLDEKAVG